MINPAQEREEMLSLLRHPNTGNRLQFDDSSLEDTMTGERFLVRDGIPVMLRKEDVFGWNRKQQKAYDWGSYLYDLLYKFGLAKRWLSEIAEMMAVRTGDYVLETSVGTGQQLLNLRNHGFDGYFFGNDISYGMLRKCRKNLEKWGVRAGLVQANAEALPFRDEAFDVVFQVGGFNFFNDKEAAVNEMIRVGKSGANLHIIDESDTRIREKSGILTRLISRFLPDSDVFKPPVTLIPDNMLDVKEAELLDGNFWMVSFQKPDKG